MIASNEKSKDETQRLAVTSDAEGPKIVDGKQAKIAVIGAGAFGSALAASALAGGNEVTLIGRDETSLSASREDPTLRGCAFITQPQFQGALEDFHLILLAVPCQVLRSVCEWISSVRKSPHSKIWIVCAAKGIEQKTLLLPHQIFQECLGNEALTAELSGPSFAKELRAGLPTAVVIASQNIEIRERAKALLHRSFFRVYDSEDVIGVEVAGALKNIIALMAGGVDGMQLGNNARAAVITRGLGEITQVGVTLGANPMTFLGLSGLGDLILTCTGDLSRNRQFGLRLARGESKESIIASMGQVIEGVTTAESAWQLSQKLGLDTPILRVAYEILYGSLSIGEAIHSLLNRKQKTEFHWIEK
jgi:glycerol-3-phosphate dehydrogenase (NAD(P)+)